MSYVNKAILRGILDPSLSFYTTTLQFTTAVLQIDALTQFGAYIRSFRIVNLDGTNQALYRQGSLAEVQKPVPINSEVSVDGWESFVQITPNAVSGNGFLELDLISRDQAELVKP